ncbi:MAG: hypothetical protein KC615_14005 [Anaerolineae bacterium]|nr:hypothetical protein [Anaerolineae bacterium]
MKKILLKILGIAPVLLLSVAITAAQTGIDNQCVELLNNIFRDLGTNCAAAESNTACYGSAMIVDPLFSDGQEAFSDEDEVFTEAGDIVDLVFPQEDFYAVAALGVSDLSLSDENWGISLVYSQANLPSNIDPLVIGLFGTTRVENGVFPDELFMLGEEVTLSLTDAVLFTSPDTFNEPHLAIEQVSGDFVADAITPDGAWVRVQYMYDREYGASRASAWVQASDVSDDVDLSVLPELGPDSQSPMQEFYIIEDNTTSSDCMSAPPSGILLQGPEEIETDVLINGVHVRLSSTGYVQLRNGVMRFSTLSGLMVLEPNTENEMIIPPGYFVDFGLPGDFEFCFGGPVNLGLDFVANNGFADFGACSPSAPAVMSPDIATSLADFGSLPSNIINYPIPPIEIVITSGNGGPIIIIILPPDLLDRIEELCNAGLLPEPICEVFGF